ncbi:MAG: hypothetical protein OXP12_03595 [Thaumarchaeota archaeon]|nr:hypothetical protein [Nitrososphaerota archaeon]MDE0266206.1 hypothetical protein [Nitrososphaerota archaeon]MDE0525952.1 hypothetical protein [Nitrososphaerota archaeon]
MAGRTLEELYRILDNVKESWERRLGKRRFELLYDDDFYASGLVSFADVWDVEAARRIVADWKALRAAEKDGRA